MGYEPAGNLLFKGPPGAAGELALLYDRGAATPTRLAAVDRNLGGGQWTQNAGLYLVNADGVQGRHLFRTKGSPASVASTSRSHVPLRWAPSRAACS